VLAEKLRELILSRALAEGTPLPPNASSSRSPASAAHRYVKRCVSWNRGLVATKSRPQRWLAGAAPGPRVHFPFVRAVRAQHGVRFEALLERARRSSRRGTAAAISPDLTTTSPMMTRHPRQLAGVRRC